MISPLRLLQTVAFLLLAISRCGFAACSGTSSSASFDTISSFSVASTAYTITSGSGFSCTSGSLLSILSTNTITATLTSANASGSTARLYNASSGSYLPYTICTSGTCGTTYGSGSTVSWSSTSLIGLLGLFNAPDSTLPLYLRTTTGSNLPAGTYTDTLSVSWNYSICFAGLLGICSYTTGSDTSTITVTLIVSNDCYIDSAPDVNFASAALPSSFSSVSSSMSVRCTLNASYSVNLASSNPVSGDWRQMSSGDSGTTRYLQYQLYQADGTAWTSSQDLSQSGTGSSQTINYSAAVNTAQGNVPAGSYSDVVTVTVTY